VPITPGGGNGGGGGGGEPRESSRNMQGAEYLPIPMVYGQRWVGGRVFLVGNTSSNQLVIAYAISLAWNGIDAYQYIELDGKDINTLGVTYNTYTGTQTSVDPLIQSAYPDHVERFTGLAYIVVRIDPYSQIFGGIPELRAQVQGRKCYNPNTGTTVYTANPVLHALDMLMAPDAGNIAWNSTNYDQASWQSAASFCETIDSYAYMMYYASAIIDNQKTALAHAKDILGEYFGDVLLTPDGKLKCTIYRDNVSPAYTIDDSYIISSPNRFDKQVQVSTILPDYAPTHVIVEYEDVNRKGESARQQSISPVFEIGWQPYQPLNANLQFTSDAITAKRLAHSIHMQSICDVRTVQFTTPQNVSAGDVAVLKDSNHAKTGVALYNTTLSITPANHPTNELAVGIVFVPRGSSWPTSNVKLVDYGTTTTGFGVSLTSTGVSVRLAGNAYNFTLDNKTTNIPHTIALHWASSTNRIVLYHNDTPYSVTTSGVTSVNASGYNVVLGDSSYSFDIVQADLRTSWSYAPNFLSIFAYLNGNSTTNIILYNAKGFVWGIPTSTPQYTTVYPVVFIKSVDYNTYNGLANVTAETFHYLARDSQYDESTSHTWVLYTESRASTSYPDPTQSPPSVSGLWYTVQAIGAQGQTRYRATVGWALSQSSFVRGYRVTLTVGANTKTLGEFARNTNQCSFDVEDPQMTHTVTVYPVNNMGTVGSGSSISFVPFTSIASVSVSATYYYTPSLHSDSDPWLQISVNYSIPSGRTGTISVCDDASRRTIASRYISTSGSGSWSWKVSVSDGVVADIFTNVYSSTIIATLQLDNGVIYSASATGTVSGQNDIGKIFSGAYIDSTSMRQQFVPIGTKNSKTLIQLQHPRNCFMVGYYGGVCVPWAIFRYESGIPNGQSSVTINFDRTFAERPGIAVTPEGNQQVWISNFTTSSVTVNRSGTSGYLPIFVMVIGPV
jgi:hypothetical protein